MLITSPLFITKVFQARAFVKCSSYLKGRILDVGCGTKPFKHYLANCTEYTGIDSSAAVNAEVVGDINDKLAFSDSYFDGVICTEVIEHVPEPGKIITEIYRVLKKDGYLYLTTPQEWSLHYEPYDYYRFTSHGIKYLLEKYGFQIITIERIGGVFSLTGQRLIDVFWSLLVSVFKLVLTLKWAERIATLFCLPFSLIFYLTGRIADRIDKRDAIGWAVLARK